MDSETKEKYIKLLRQKNLCSYSITFEEFDQRARKLLTMQQIGLHNEFIIHYRPMEIGSTYTDSVSAPKQIGDNFFKNEPVDHNVSVKQEKDEDLNNSELKESSLDLCMPDIGFMRCKIAVLAWDNQIDNVDDNVAELMVHSCRIFIKNILTAMITKKKGYKVRDGHFQHGFNQPVPDPLIRNFNNIVDDNKYNVGNETINEQDILFSYSCGKRMKTDNLLTVQLLKDTIRENATSLGIHTLKKSKLYSNE